jgi:hypothetical protein
MEKIISLSKLLSLWKQFGDIPTVFAGEEVDTIEEPFLEFQVGTHREKVWHWFESQNPKFLVGEIMNGQFSANCE